MADFTVSLSDQELIDEVRDSLAGLDSSKIPDSTITQTAERFVIPLLNNNIPEEVKKQQAEYQDSFDSAVIAWTAELSFNAWMTFTRLRDAEVEAYTDPDQYKQQLAQKTNLALQLVNTTRPSDIPKETVTVKHDGVQRTVDLSQEWVYV
jgi:hypothetical protein